MDKKIKELINELNKSGNKIWYIPVRSEEAHKNYLDTIISRRTFNQKKLQISYWAFRLGVKNEQQFEKMSKGDYVCFITRDDEGYETIDSICILSDKYIDPRVGEMNWNDSNFELIIEFEIVFILKNKLRLTLKREKLKNILQGVPDAVFHNGYEMFRQWNMNERITRTKLGLKLIEEDEFIKRIIDHCGGSYIGGDYKDSSVIKEDNISYKTNKKDLNEIAEDLFSKVDLKKLEIPRDVNVITRKVQPNDGKKTLSDKVNRTENRAVELRKENQRKLGFMGEEYIYRLLCEKNSKLLSELGIIGGDDSLKIEWDNLDYKDNLDGYEDKSLGHDIRVRSSERIIRLEVKTSLNNAGYYSITRNELKEMAMYTEDYYIVKLNYLCDLLKGESPEIILEKFPVANIIENLNRVKSMEVYI